MKRVVGIVLAGLVGVGTMFSGMGLVHAEEEELVTAEVVTEEFVNEDILKGDDIAEKEVDEENDKSEGDESSKINTEEVIEDIEINTTLESGESQDKDTSDDKSEESEDIVEVEEKVLSDYGYGGGVSDNEYPVIVVPGIMGSNLYTKRLVGGYTKIWAPNTQTDFILHQFWDTLKVDALDVKQPLHVLNNEKNQVKESKREYGADNTYQKLVDMLCTEYEHVYFFSYDWRLSNENSATELSKLIEDIKTKVNVDKVNIVAHSMGGLVTSRYITQNANNKNNINKIVTCGTPYEGAPSLIHRSLTNVTINNKTADWLFSIPLLGISKEQKSKMPSLSQLAPTGNLYNSLPNWYVSKTEINRVRRSVKLTNGGKGGGGPIGEEYFYEEIPVKVKHGIDYSGFKERCTKIYGGNYSDALIFHNRIKDGSLNKLYDLDNTYFVVGINQPTIISGVFDESGGGFSLSEVTYDNIGDGTVPYHSATMLDNIKSKGTDQKGIKKSLMVSTDHGGTVKNNKALNYILGALKGVSKNIPSDDSLNKRSFTTALVQCPVDVTIEKNGEILSSADEKIKTSFGQIDYLGDSGDIKSVYLEGSIDDTYNISLNGTDEGVMDLTLDWYNEEGDKITERQFLQIPVTQKTQMKIETDRYDISKLLVDSDGDGSFDDTWYSWDGDVGYRIEEETQEETTQPSEEQNKETQPATTEKQASASTAQPASVVKAATAATSATTAAAKTGDTNLTALWITLSSVSAGIMGVIIVALKKRRLD